MFCRQWWTTTRGFILCCEAWRQLDRKGWRRDILHRGRSRWRVPRGCWWSLGGHSCCYSCEGYVCRSGFQTFLGWRSTILMGQAVIWLLTRRWEWKMRSIVRILLVIWWRIERRWASWGSAHSETCWHNYWSCDRRLRAVLFFAFRKAQRIR